MPQTVDKSFKVKHGLTVIEGGSFGGPVIVGNPTLVNHAVTKAYVDALSFGGGGGGGSITVADEAPTVAIQGSGWYNSTTGKLYIYFDQFWVEVSYAEAGPQGQMGIPGPEGPKGDQGETGVGLPNVLTIGDVTAGYLPNATITGTSPNQVLNLVLPRGEQGVRGEQGLPGEPGTPGLPGQVGPEGPAGPRGLQGIPGTPGVSGAITVTAPIVNSGSINEAILSLDSSVTRNSIAQTLTNKTIDSPIFTGQSLEDIVISSTPFATEYVYSVKSGGIHYITAAASANGIVSFRGDASTTLNSFMPIGKSITCVLIISNGNTSFGVSGVKIDGASITPKWQSGTLPVGSTNATDAYTFTIIKTSTDTFTVFASQTKFA